MSDWHANSGSTYIFESYTSVLIIKKILAFMHAHVKTEVTILDLINNQFYWSTSSYLKTKVKTSIRKMPRILVTGGAGYVGSHTVIELINYKFEVVAVDNMVNAIMGKIHTYV